MRVPSAVLLLTSILLGFSSPRDPEAGSITGIVIDESSGELLIGANVVIDGTATGSTTDLDGRYTITDLDTGIYSLVISFIGFTTRTVHGVEVRPDAATRVDVSLTPEALGMDEVVVEAVAARNTEASLLRLQSRAPAIMDGISAQQIRRSPDSNSGDALRRVTSVSVMDGRFVFVRGIPERYNGTLLNGTSVASTEPDRRAFAYDLLPANLLSHVTVAKSATPDLPSDFSGGMISIATVDFPEEFTLSMSLAGSYTDQTTGRAFLLGPRGSQDFLGVDDGTRALPDGFPERNLNFMPADSVAMLAETFPDGWARTARVAPVNSNFSFSAGGTIPVGAGKIGVIGALSYRSGYSASGLIRRDYEALDDLRYDYSGVQNTYDVRLGGILNVSYRPSPNHSLGIKNLYSRTADDQYTEVGGPHFEAQLDQHVTAMRFVRRDVYSGQLNGEHHFPVLWPRGIQLRWEAYHTFSARDEPDYRRLSYARSLSDPDQPYRAVVAFTVGMATGGRFYSAMNEDGLGGGVHVTLPVRAGKLTMGASADVKDRAFSSRMIGAVSPRRNFDYSLLQQPIDEIFRPENFGGRGFVLAESSAGASSYTAGQEVLGAYAMLDIPVAFLSERLRFAGGLRLERSQQRLTSTTLDGQPVEVDELRTNVLPSANLSYRVTERTNLRAAYGRSVNRPELRELAPFAYYDFEHQVTIYGNPELRQAGIDNFDLRLETYPGSGQLLSGSLFYKHFDRAIERVVVPGVALGAERTYANAVTARNYGFEVEGRFSLRGLSAFLAKSSVLGNYTWIRSTVDMAAAAGVIERRGRPLQGQSPYVVNLGFNFVEPSLGTSLSISYNRLGTRVVEVATAFESDVMEAPRDVIDLVVTQPFMSRYEIRFAARDALGQHQLFLQDGQLLRRNHRFSSYSLGVALRY